MSVFKIYGYYHEYYLENLLHPDDRGFEGVRDDAVSAFLCSPDEHPFTRGDSLGEVIESGISFHLSSDCLGYSYHGMMYCYSRLLLVIPDPNEAMFARMRWAFALAGPLEADADFSWVG